MSGDEDITEAALAELVPAFYARVRQDPLIGPVFDAAIDDWPEHLDKLTAFWSAVMLGSGRFRGNPMAAHARHVDTITPAMFERWLELWGEVTRALLPAGQALRLQEKADRIGESLQLGLDFHRGTLMARRARPAA